MALPPRTVDTMSDAIALSSPSGHMSKRARAAADKQLSEALFGPGGLQRQPVSPATAKQQRAQLLHQAAELRGLAVRGMRPRAHRKRAAELEAEAAKWWRPT